MGDTKETIVRVMTKARVFHRDGVITQVFIDQSTIGTLPEDKLKGAEVAFIKANGEALGLAVAMCLLHIAQEKTQAGKNRAARMNFAGVTDAPANASSTKAQALVQEVMDGARQSEPGIAQGLDPKTGQKPE
jgi:hypothetical protein